MLHCLTQNNCKIWLKKKYNCNHNNNLDADKELSTSKQVSVIKNIPPADDCTICLEPVYDKCYTDCCHSFCYECIKKNHNNLSNTSKIVNYINWQTRQTPN